MRNIFICLCSCMLLAACGNRTKTNQSIVTDSTASATSSPHSIDIHHAENSLDYVGTYKGIFPAADCPGIETTLVINANKTFTQHFSYLERNASFEEKGTYTLKGNLLTLKEENGTMSYYKVEENRVRKLDGNKEIITGDLADFFILNKK